jgi:hypothetical protein
LATACGIAHFGKVAVENTEGAFGIYRKRSTLQAEYRSQPKGRSFCDFAKHEPAPHFLRRHGRITRFHHMVAPVTNITAGAMPNKAQIALTV